MAYSVRQLQDFLRRVGWPEDRITIMAAVGMSESGGDASAINPGRGAGGRVTNEYSVGLWQINMKAHGTKYGNVAQLQDPLTNARAALAIYKIQGLRAWGSYTDGRYKSYLASSQAAYQNKGGSVPGLDVAAAGAKKKKESSDGGLSAGAVVGLLLLVWWMRG
jgi:hypothetical protein